MALTRRTVALRRANAQAQKKATAPAEDAEVTAAAARVATVHANDKNLAAAAREAEAGADDDNDEAGDGDAGEEDAADDAEEDGEEEAGEDDVEAEEEDAEAEDDEDGEEEEEEEEAAPPKKRALAQASARQRRPKSARGLFSDAASGRAANAEDEDVSEDEDAGVGEDAEREAEAEPEVIPAAVDDINIGDRTDDRFEWLNSDDEAGGDDDDETEMDTTLTDQFISDSEEDDERPEATGHQYGIDLGPNPNQQKATLRGWSQQGWQTAVPDADSRGEYPGLSREQGGPTEMARSCWESPIDLFFLFMPRQLWRIIAQESNRYMLQSIPAWVDAKFAQQRKRKAKDPTFAVQSKKAFRKDFAKIAPIGAEDPVRVIALLIARTLCPHKRRLAHHWSTTQRGAVPKGTFTEFMSRNRFDEIMRALHFTNNYDQRALEDRAWKIRSVVDCLQKTFRRAYNVPNIISFDEGILPSQSAFNGMKTYMKDKPHKWGTKLFISCCARTSYCLRIEVYCGAKPGASAVIDDKSGPDAVIRNMKIVLKNDRSGHHLVVIDRFYTSVALLLALLAMQVYAVGTVQTSRLGFPDKLKEPSLPAKRNRRRGDTLLQRCKAVPALVACTWQDSKPVHFLATGASTKTVSVDRRVNATERESVPAPKLVTDYHRNMGGVDVADQLRLQRYSLQMACKYKKYYKGLFLGLCDIALTNAFILYRMSALARGHKPASHEEFLVLLHEQLLAVDADFMALPDVAAPPTPTPARLPPRRRQDAEDLHVPTQVDDKHLTSAGQLKRRQRACKVCSLLREPGVPRGKATKNYCPACSDGPALFYLCNTVRPDDKHHPDRTCFQVWHEDWERGERMPFGISNRIQMRAPGKPRRPRDEDGTSAAETKADN